jgi:hypothetical protein
MSLVLMAFVAALFLVVNAMGPLESPIDPPKARPVEPPLARPQPTPQLAQAQQPLPLPAEPEPVETDELFDFVPCQQANSEYGSGSGSLFNWRAHYDDQGRLVILAAYQGRLGAIQIRQDLSSQKPVTALDISGLFQVEQLTVPSPGGLVKGLRLGQHRGFTRLSVNYLENRRPQRAVPEALCRPDQTGGLLATRLTFQPPPESLALARSY